MISRRSQKYVWMDFYLEAKSKIADFVVIGILLFLLVLFFRWAFDVRKQPAMYRGKIVDKWFSIKETQQGSFVSSVFLIEVENGRKISINPSDEDFEKVKIGDFVENDGHGIKKLENR